jgi:hypothetical protein
MKLALERGCQGDDWIHLAQYRDKEQVIVNMELKFRELASSVDVSF